MSVHIEVPIVNSLAHSPRQIARTTSAAIVAFVLLLFPLASAGNAANNSQKVVSGTLTWGVKESFRTYLTGFAEGRMTASDGARLDSANVPTFEKGQGTLDAGKGAISYKGKVRYYGHAGALDFTLIDPKLILDPAGKGHLEIGYQVGSGKPKRLNIVDITPGGLTFAGKNASLKARTYLTKAGMEVFSYQGHPFYTENLELDQLSAAVTLDAATPPVTTPPAPSTPSTSTPTKKPSASSPAPSKPASPSKPAPSAPASTPAAPTSSASLTWGVKESFRTYIASPIANGRITVSGHASASGSGFTFPQSSTNAKPPSAAGTTNYTGSVNFYGHDGILNLTFSNPRVVIPNSGNTGQLVVDYAQNGSAKGTLTIASLNLAGGSKSASSSGVIYRGIPATLTQQGTGVFSYQGHGFYPAGIALDPVTFTVGAANAKVSGSSGPSVVTSQVSTHASSSAPSKGDTAPPVSAAAAASAAKQGEGVLLWGVRSSFRSYILGPIAHGSITISGGTSNASNAWAFPQSGKSSDGGASYRGSVKFYGHDGILNLTFSDPAIRMTSANSAVLSMSVNGKRADMVNLNLSSATKTNNSGATTYTGAPASLTAAGAQVFSYQGHAFYPAGSPMDPVTFTVGAVSHKSAGSSTTSTSTALPGSASASASGGGQGTQGQSTSPKVKLPNLTCPATGTDLTWGVKESFRSYIDGSIANGEWTPMDGARYQTPNFIWPKGTGSFSKDGHEGTVEFPGKVHFTGHDGALDTTIGHPTIEIAGNQAYLRLDVKSTLMDAALQGKTQWVTKNDVRFVQLDFSRIAITKQGNQSVITGTNVPTTLTADGSAAFPNYTAGTAMDPVTFRLSTGSNCATAKSGASAKASAKSSSPRPSTPTQTTSANHDGTNMAPWLGAGAVGVLAVGGAVAVARRRMSGGASTTATTTPEDVE